MHLIEKHAVAIRWLTIGLGLCFAVMYANQQILTGDQTQMLEKGYLGAYHQTWAAFGNAASAVGNVPGSLSAFVIGGPLLIWDSPWSPMLFLILLRLCSFLLLDAVIQKIFSPPVRMLFAIIYWLNPWLLYDSLLYNPSYLCFFAALHLWSAFKLREHASFIYSFLHILAIGGAMQFHYSWPILAVISCYLLYRRMARPSWSGVAVASVVILASLIPYCLEYINNDSLSRESDRYFGYGAVHVYPVLKAIFYWLRYGSTLFSNRLITDVSFDWITSISWLKMIFQYCWQALLFIIGTITVVLSVNVNMRAWKTIKPAIKRGSPIADNKQWMLLYAGAAVLAIVINAMLSPITFSYWHLILTFPFALFPLLVAAEAWQEELPNRFIKGMGVITVFFIAVNFVAAHDSDKYSYKVDYVEQVTHYLNEKGLQREQ
ncbi:3-deoxy-D-manno-octulosonic acid transferase [Enterovibrio norvegicus]|uniref:3-deoxy-D-manno-octulosonic acid transferase n=1 Tax=Enterovibrio norvegicus TaxID=188144 RepID=UPI000C846954|nr:3-deoxy-D-manno-octulosonic acid transferase [Enterovibrio norvegicus]PMH71799.1 3-deoxy-D-manno-octulosonic acid transferase [Enterovibrio norvegicus]